MLSIKDIKINKIHCTSPNITAKPTWVSSSQADSVIVEEPLEIWLQQDQAQAKPLQVSMRTPGDDINLVKGWLLTTGLISALDEIRSISHRGTQKLKHGTSNRLLVTTMPKVKVNTEQVARLHYTSSSCGVCGQQSIEDLLALMAQRKCSAHHNTEHIGKLAIESIYTISELLRKEQGVFAQTGGNHGAGLFSIDNTGNLSNGLLDCKEDVGRHNALDKLIGAHGEQLFSVSNNDAHATNLAFGIVLSGRVGFDMVQKAAMANISFILAIGAPSSLAIELAQECGICMLGFIKADSVNVYSWDTRVASQSTIKPLP